LAGISEYKFIHSPRQVRHGATGHDARHVDFRAFPWRPLGRQGKPKSALQRGPYRDHTEIGSSEFGKGPAKFSDRSADGANDIDGSIHVRGSNFITRAALALPAGPPRDGYWGLPLVFCAASKRT
jgi:hypothetical protein